MSDLLLGKFINVGLFPPGFNTNGSGLVGGREPQTKVRCRYFSSGTLQDTPATAEFANLLIMMGDSETFLYRLLDD
jgi:hypothetical protein